MAENFRNGDRANWNDTRITTEPEVTKRTNTDKSGSVGSEDDHRNPAEKS